MLRLVDIRLPQLRPFTAGWLRHPTRSSHTGLYLLLTHIGCLEIVWWVVTQTGAIIFATEERDKG